MSELEEDILNTFNAFEAAIVNLKQCRAKKHGVKIKRTTTIDNNIEIPEYNPENIPWTRTEGPNGAYERFPAYQQKPSTSVDYVNLLEDLKRHNGKLQRAGLFYWLWSDSTTIGRKPAKK